MKISFCTTCMGRAHHLKETLPQNIRDNPPSDAIDVEFVVLNYNSKDDLHEWITMDPEMPGHIASGRLRYGRTMEPEFFHMAHAKNMAHRLATGDVLCNLDADNFTGADFAKYLGSVFKKEPHSIVTSSRNLYLQSDPADIGFGGRVIISREDYLRLHGYDETYKGWGEEDCDFVRRAKGLLLKNFRIDNIRFARTIRHTDEQRVENMPDSDQELVRVKTQKSFSKRPFVAKLFNKLAVLHTPVQANTQGNFGNGTVTLANGQVLVLGSVQNAIISPFRICALGIPELVRGRLAPRIIQEETAYPNQQNSDTLSMN